MERPRWPDVVVQAGRRWRRSGEGRRCDGATAAAGCWWSWPRGQDAAVERPRAQDVMMGPTCGQDAAVEPAAMVE
jgi:hypothetical protein